MTKYIFTYSVKLGTSSNLTGNTEAKDFSDAMKKLAKRFKKPNIHRHEITITRR